MRTQDLGQTPHPRRWLTSNIRFYRVYECVAIITWRIKYIYDHVPVLISVLMKTRPIPLYRQSARDTSVNIFRSVTCWRFIKIKVTLSLDDRTLIWGRKDSRSSISTPRCLMHLVLVREEQQQSACTRALAGVDRKWKIPLPIFQSERTWYVLLINSKTGTSKLR